MPSSDVFVSVVAPLRDDAEVLEAFVPELLGVLEAAYANFEVVLVDDGSRDRTRTVVERLLAAHKCLRYVRLSRRFGEEVAISAGLDSVIGDFTVVMRPAVDPPAAIPAMVARARAGHGVVFGVSRTRPPEPWWARAGSALFWWFARRVLDVEVPASSTTFQVLSRQAVNALTRFKDKRRSLRLLSTLVGESEEVEYEPLARRAPRVRGFGESVQLAIDIAVSSSTRPLRIVSALGLVASTLNLLYAVYVVAIYLFKPHVQEGWTTTSLQLSGMFFLLFAIVTVLSEYIGRVLEESRDRPLYHVAEERNSNVLVADADRRNVVRESVGP
jgi:glycosyltransferase involved in cell wall biosynthesis